MSSEHQWQALGKIDDRHREMCLGCGRFVQIDDASLAHDPRALAELKTGPCPGRSAVNVTIAHDPPPDSGPVTLAPPACYVCGATLDQRGRGEVPLCLRCRAGDGERTPEVVARCESTMLDERCTQAAGHDGDHTGTPVPWPRRPEGVVTSNVNHLGKRPARLEAVCGAGDGRIAVEGDAITCEDYLAFIRRENEAISYTYRTEAPCGMSVLAQSLVGLNHGLREHRATCGKCQPLCRLCPAPAVHLGQYCQSCWCSRLTEMERRAATDAVYDRLKAEINDSMRVVGDAMVRDQLRPACVRCMQAGHWTTDCPQGVGGRARRDDRGELGDGSEDDEC